MDSIMKSRGIKTVLKIVVVLSALALTLGCPYYRPDEIEPMEMVLAKNRLLSSSPEFTRTFMPHPRFVHRNARLLEKGMAPKEVEGLFGTPDRTLYKTFGLETPEPWPALVFEYDMGSHPDGKYLRNTNTFVFSRRFEPPRLSYWDIQMLYKEHAATKDVRKAGTFRP